MALLEEIAELKAVLPEHAAGSGSRKRFRCTGGSAAIARSAVRRRILPRRPDPLYHGGTHAGGAANGEKSLFVADALTNPAHIRFALKVTLAAMICYLIYSGLGWPGISTAFVTCCFIALENTEATLRKGWLRLIGCAGGGLCGYLAIIFLIPHMESIIGSLVLLTVAGCALAGWVAAGTDRISYGGCRPPSLFLCASFKASRRIRTSPSCATG